MYLSLIFVIVVGYVSANPGSRCKKVTLQPDIDFTKIEGLWEQHLFSRGSEYEQMACFNLNIHTVNPEKSTFHMDSRFRLPNAGEEPRGLPHNSFIVFDTKTSWAEREEGEPYIGDHVATDYDNYLIMYQCDPVTGVAIVDVELKAGVPRLSAEKMEKVEVLLLEMNVKVEDLEKADQSACDYPK